MAAGGSSLDYAQGVAVDASGNSTITGYFGGTASFGANTLTSAGAIDVYVARISPAGKVLWAVSAGGTSADSGTDVAIDAKGNSYITGTFSGTAKFGKVSLSTLGTNDIFVAKLDSSGKFLWALSTQGTTKDWTPRVAVDSAGQAHITGYLTGKVAASGASFIWTDYAAGVPYDIALDSAGNSYIAGTFTGQAKFGATTLTAVSQGDVFVARLDAKGAFTMAAQASGQSGSKAIATALDLNGAGDIGVVGTFHGTHSFGSSKISSTGSGQKVDVFAARMSKAGAFTWAVAGGGAGDDAANGVVINALGGLHLAGSFSGNATFGSTSLKAQGSGGKSDIFWSRVSPTGAFLAASSAGGGDLEVAAGLGMDSAGYTYLLGVFKGTAGFGTSSLTTKGGFDLFLARLDRCGKF